jgi:hypothetical protein
MGTAIKTKVIFSSLAALSAVSLIAFTSAFAWFNFDKTMDQPIVASSGNVQITGLSASYYKYQYPALDPNISYSSITDATPLNYDKTGIVVTDTLVDNGTVTKSLVMNKFDPVWLDLNNQTVYDLFTNVVIKITATFKSYSSTAFTISAKKLTDAEYTAKTSAAASSSSSSSVSSSESSEVSSAVSSSASSSSAEAGSSEDYRASSYLDYWAASPDFTTITSVDYSTPYNNASAVTTTYTNADDIVFFYMKNYEQNNTASYFRSSDSQTAQTSLMLL